MWGLSPDTSDIREFGTNVSHSVIHTLKALKCEIRAQILRPKIIDTDHT